MRVVGWGVGLLLALAPLTSQGASAGRSSGPPPGPPILYQAPAVAPQMTNAGIWRAQPILVSGATAYRSGEYLYQDFLYDDHGAALTSDPQDQRSGGNLF